MSSSTKSSKTEDALEIPAAVDRPHPQRVGAGSLGFVPELESLRAIGALMVAAYHVANMPTGLLPLWNDPRSWTSPIWSGLFRIYSAIFNPTGGVNLFFVLSGFVLASSIARGPQGLLHAARHFFIGRIFRIYPAVISTVLLFCAVFWLTGALMPWAFAAAYQPGSIVRNMLLIDCTIDGVMWSLQVEALAIPLIFAVTIGQQRLGGKFTLLVGTLLLVPFLFRPYQYLVAHGAFATFFYLFVIGIGTHVIGPPVVRWIGRAQLPLIIVALVVLFCVPAMLLGLFSRVGRLSQGIAAAGVIAILVYGPPATGLQRILNWPVFRFYGRISYSFYLLHPLTLIAIGLIPGPLSRVLDAGVPGVVLAVGLTIGSVVAITPLAWLSWRFVEIPGIAAGRRLSPKRRNASPVRWSARRGWTRKRPANLIRKQNCFAIRCPLQPKHSLLTTPPKSRTSNK